MAAYLTGAAVDTTEYSRRHFRILAALSVLVPCAYIADYLVARPYFDTLGIRLAAFLMVIPLMFPTSAEVKLGTSGFAWYFVGTVTYVLPFTYGLMLAMNGASAPPGASIDVFWIIQYVIALFLFIQLVHNGALASLLWALSVVSIVVALLFLESVNWAELERVMIYPITGYLTAFGFGLITNRNIDYVNAEKLRTASVIGSNIAHELRTPLATIRSLSRSLSKYSDLLFAGYETAKANQLNVGDLSPKHLNGLKSALATIEHEVEYSNTIIDMLLLNTWDGRSPSSQTILPSIEHTIRESLTRFPFANSTEANLVGVMVNRDFPVKASEIMLTHVFFNLIKNAIYHAQRAPKGRVEVIIGSGGTREIEVRDTGPGIPSAKRKRVFDRFYTTGASHQGAGIGLSFCKMVMESIGGEIHCESREGEYTTFRLVFPPVESNSAAEFDP